MPSLNGPQGICAAAEEKKCKRRKNRKKIGKKYDIKSARAGSEISALKAVLEGMLIKARRQIHVQMSTRALSGIFKPGCTFAKNGEKGRPLSRENAHKSRLTEAMTLKNETKTTSAIIATKRLVADLDPVAW